MRNVPLYFLFDFRNSNIKHVAAYYNNGSVNISGFLHDDRKKKGEKRRKE